MWLLLQVLRRDLYSIASSLAAATIDCMHPIDSLSTQDTAVALTVPLAFTLILIPWAFSYA